MDNSLDRILKMIYLSHKLKTEGRHCWHNDGRRESVAEHVWCMSFMAMLLSPHLSYKVDMEKVLKMIIVHDLVEAEAGDTPFYISDTPEGKAMKVEKEEIAMQNIQKLLESDTGTEIRELWTEFENRETPEARFCVALDKLEASIQHNNSPIETWTEKDQQRTFQIEHFCAVDPVLAQLNRMVIEQATMKMEKAGIDANKIKASVTKK